MFIVRALMVVVSTVFFGSISLATSFCDPDGRRQNSVARAWARSLLWTGGVKVKVEGLERISPGAGYVIASNHASYMDTPVVLANIPVQFRFLAKRGLFKVPFLGNHLSRAGHIPVPREDPRAAVKTLTRAAEIIRDRGISILIFPEGGRSRHGELGLFKDGAAYIGIKAGAPIVPVALLGTRHVLPFGSGHIRPGNVVLRIGEPIDTRQHALRDRGRITEELRARITAMRGIESPAGIHNGC